MDEQKITNGFNAPPTPPGPPTPPDPTLPQSLADAALQGTSDPQHEEQEEPYVEEAVPFSPDDLIGLVGELSSIDLPADQRQAYMAELAASPIVKMGVHMSGITDALAKYGIGAGGGALPDWAKVLIGVGALGYGVATLRRKYAPQDKDSIGDPDSYGHAGSDPQQTSGVDTII
ncbi:hypothetical protein [Deinococcus cellulosilyticus]|uniref:Uncharacterized protein n=1 Tax=Deinococcus cellulosilyticus (strain DSM 18568 / NBRC 106333 / KACC 11606 / 5516J-15) TaxID=1223518 RepID=A0A511MYT1_DEIC1|nr:hypothetical protein [Deinococcus cellulosilyticus]GEM45316.1 hypothetical protein DC3_09510 [Deinococcus cellulosilyticus NBRC 106333 = KACC 11606]